MYQLSIVVPTFNEKDNIPVLFERVDKALQGINYELIFIDDSNDETPRVIEELQQEHSNVVLRHREDEKGLATAVLLGFSIAQGKYLAVMDADLQHPPEILRSMFAVICRGFDFCIPSRFIPGGSDGAFKFHRKVISAVARYIGKIALRSLRQISDPTSGLFMFRRECIKNADLRPIGWKIMVEVLAMSDYRNVCEIPYSFCKRNSGESKLSGKVTREYLMQLLRLMRREKKRKVKVLRYSQAKTDKCVERLNERVLAKAR